MVSAMLNNIPNLNKKCATFANDALPYQACSFTHVRLQTSNDVLKIINNTTNLSSKKQLVADASTLALRVSTNVAEECSRLPRLWREIQGLNNWENLVEPLDPLLRQEIIRYGELVTACYEAFDLDPNSKRYLNCKYGKKNMLHEVGLGHSGYEITRYIYATPDINIPIHNGACYGRWIGYVAVSDDAAVKRLGRRDIIVTFRGTVTNAEWIANLMSSLTPARLDPHNPRPEVKVEAGFLSLYTSNESDCKFGLQSCRDQLLSEVSRLLNKYIGEEISITLAGHSMGSALALLFAYDLTELELNRDHSNNEIPVTVFSFGGPRVGNFGFKERCDELGVKVLRIVNVNDPITKLPGFVFNENFKVQFGEKYEFSWKCSCYAHVGVELLMDFFKMHDPSCVHDMGTYVRLLKCPKTSQVARKEGEGFFKKATDFVITTARNLDGLPWKDAALNMVNLVQSQRV